MNTVAVVGSINVDFTTYLDRWPKVGETVTANKFNQALGGKGTNQCIAASRLGCKATMIGAIGTDGVGQFVEKELSALNIITCVERARDFPTGMAFIDVVPGGDNIIRLERGANWSLDEAAVRKETKAISNATVVLLQNEIPFIASLEAAKIGQRSGALIIMDPAPCPDPFWNVIDTAAFDIITPNAGEVGRITGHEPGSLNEALAAAKNLRRQGLKGVVVTMGQLGVAWATEDSTGTRAGLTVDSVDTVAAGDCFNGALASAISSGRTLEDAIGFAVGAAALSTTRPGASESAPTLSEVELFLKNQPVPTIQH